MKRVSVIVPSFNSSRTLRACLSAILDSDYPVFEVILSDDGSDDGSEDLVKECFPQVIFLKSPLRQSGSGAARNRGQRFASGEIKVFIDSDVVIQRDSIRLIVQEFQERPDIHWILGSFSPKAVSKSLFSLYKNLYMNHIFSKLPEKVDFLFGSICASGYPSNEDWPEHQNVTEDTEHGLSLAKHSQRQIYFLSTLQVLHLKEYSFWSILKNDFLVPASWVPLFLNTIHFKSILKSNRFAHASNGQIIGLFIALAPLVGGLLIFFLEFPVAFTFLSATFFLWLIWNRKFLLHLGRHLKSTNLLAAIAFTLLDQWVMMAGILWGSCHQILVFFRRMLRKKKSPALREV